MAMAVDYLRDFSVTQQGGRVFSIQHQKYASIRKYNQAFINAIQETMMEWCEMKSLKGTATEWVGLATRFRNGASEHFGFAHRSGKYAERQMKRFGGKVKPYFWSGEMAKEVLAPSGHGIYVRKQQKTALFRVKITFPGVRKLNQIKDTSAGEIYRREWPLGRAGGGTMGADEIKWIKERLGEKMQAAVNDLFASIKAPVRKSRAMKDMLAKAGVTQ